MVDFIQPLDIKTLFLDYFFGSMQLFVFGFIIIFSYVCARYGFSNRLYGTTLVISLLLISLVSGTNAIYLLIVSIVGVLIYNQIKKLFS